MKVIKLSLILSYFVFVSSIKPVEASSLWEAVNYVRQTLSPYAARTLQRMPLKVKNLPLVRNFSTQQNSAHPQDESVLPSSSSGPVLNNYKSYLDVLDESGFCTGEKLSRKEIHKQGKIHRAVHLFLFDKNSNLLLQRRSDTVDHYPGMLSISLTGHVDAGESSGMTLRREIKEELGLDTENMRLDFLFSFRRDATLSSEYIDRQINDVYACFHDFQLKDIKFQAEEVKGVELIPFEKFKQMVKSKKSDLAPVYERECQEVVYFLGALLKNNSQ